MVEQIQNVEIKRQRSSSWLRWLVIGLLVVGVVFRLYQPGHKVYWFDETMTSLRIAGYTQETLVAAAVNQPPITAEDFLERYQYPDHQRTRAAALAALKTHPEHSPLYYVMAWGWLYPAGHSVGYLRLLSALFGLATIPASYWLGRELFQAAEAGWAIAAVVAISPFHVLYSQEAREYSLWTLAIVLSSAALLWARRRNTVPAWSLYGVTLALGLYSHVFYGFVVMSHGLYMILAESWRPTRRLLAYGGAVLLGLALFAPWLMVILDNWDRLLGNTVGMTLDRQGFLPLFWLLNLSRLFFDLNQGPSAINPAHYLLLALCAYALWYLYQRAPRATSLFVLTLIGVTAIALMGSDLLLGGRRSTITRYPIPCYVGLQVAVGYLLWRMLQDPDQSRRAYQRWRAGAIALALSGVLSIAVNAHHALWWNKSYAVSRFNPAAAEIINQSDRPLMITDRDPSEVLAFVHRLEADVQVQLIARPNAPDQPPDLRPIVPDIPPATYSDVFLYQPSQGLRLRMERRGMPSSDVNGGGWLWTVSIPSP
ncbi:MAG: glycosyltransferase family 39 protein [Elainellaceae cyanobacterium]